VLARARALLLELAPAGVALPVDDWASLANICDTGWLSVSRRPSAATVRIARRRFRVLSSAPMPFTAFAALRAGEGPLHLRGKCAALPCHDGGGALWRVDAQEDAEGRTLIEEARDFVIALEEGGYVYVLSKGGHLVSGAPLRPGDAVSVFGFADEILDRTGLASSPHGRGGFMHAIRSGSDLPLLVTHVVR
jgi:hypothetical protein